MVIFLAMLKNLWYIIKHKWYVLFACVATAIYYNKPMLIWRGLIHDISKFSVAEYYPYAMNFFYPLYSEAVDKSFKAAWLHHIHNNKHHPEYWVLITKKSLDNNITKIYYVDMPEIYRLEMICDWYGASKAKGLGADKDVREYYNNCKSFMFIQAFNYDTIGDELGIVLDSVNMLRKLFKLS